MPGRRRLFAVLSGLLAAAFCVAAAAQGTVQQAGAITAFHPPVWYGNGVIADGGSSTAPMLSAVAIFNGSACPLTISSQAGPGVTTALAGQFGVCVTASAITFTAAGLNANPTPAFAFSAKVTAPQLVTTATTFAGLDAAPVAGERGFITDDNSACTFGTTATGGGSTKCPVVYNGTNWTAG